MKSIEEVREFFSDDRFATENGMYIEEIGDCYSKCAVKITDRHRNAVGGLMGGVSFTLADFAFAVAANLQNAGTVSLNTSIAFLSQPKGDTLYAEAHLKKDGKSTCYYCVDVYDNAGVRVADAVITGFHLSK